MSEVQDSVPQVSIDELGDLLAQGILLVDVREPDEYHDGHVGGAVNLPMGEVPDRLDAFPADAPVLVICQSGGRSQRTCTFLVGQGIDARNVAGGTGAWISSGRPAVRGPA